MNKLIRFAAFAAIATVGMSQAQAAVQTLPDCYERVIADCNQGDHAQSCATAGMNECDKVFPAPLSVTPGVSLTNKPVVVPPMPLPRPAHLMSVR